MIAIELIQDIVEFLRKLKQIDMSKFLKTFLVAAFIVSIIFYVAGTVSAASFYISEWSSNIRMVVSIFWVFALAVSAGISAEISGKN